MGLKVNEFVIQAKINEGENAEKKAVNNSGISKSIKKEIIDEVMDKVIALLDKDKSRH